MHDSINMQTTDNTGEITDFISIKSIYGLIKDVLWLLDIFIRVALPFMSDINESYFQKSSESLCFRYRQLQLFKTQYYVGKSFMKNKT